MGAATSSRPYHHASDHDRTLVLHDKQQLLKLCSALRRAGSPATATSYKRSPTYIWVPKHPAVDQVIEPYVNDGIVEELKVAVIKGNRVIASAATSIELMNQCHMLQERGQRVSAVSPIDQLGEKQIFIN